MNNIIGFHNPGENYGFLSNWYLSEFTIDDQLFTSVEQYMMYSKAMLFHDLDIATKILDTSDVAKIKELGRCVSNYNDSIWNGMRQVIVYKGLIGKFSQNDSLKFKLLDTGNSILAECAIKDKIWGIGISISDDERYNIEKWKGQNLLGYTLMLVRNDLKTSGI